MILLCRYSRSGEKYSPLSPVSNFLFEIKLSHKTIAGVIVLLQRVWRNELGHWFYDIAYLYLNDFRVSIPLLNGSRVIMSQEAERVSGPQNMMKSGNGSEN